MRKMWAGVERPCNCPAIKIAVCNTLPRCDYSRGLLIIRIGSPTRTLHAGTPPGSAVGAAHMPRVGPPCGPPPYGSGRYPSITSRGCSSSSRVPVVGSVVGMTHRPLTPRFRNTIPEHDLHRVNRAPHHVTSTTTQHDGSAWDGHWHLEGASTVELHDVCGLAS